MSLTKYPNGVSSFGIPVLGGVPAGVGVYFFVDSGIGSDGNTGKEPAKALATLAKAVSLATASNGDVIYVMEGHAENYTTTVTINKAGIRIIGLGSGGARPTFSFTNAAGKITVSSNNVEMYNLIFKAAVTAVANPINVTGDDFVMSNCQFTYTTAATDDFMRAVNLSTADRAKIFNTEFLAPNAAVGYGAAIRICDSDFTEVRNCKFLGNFGTAFVKGPSTGASASIGLVIADCYGMNDNPTGGVAVSFAAAEQGMLYGNRFATRMVGYNTQVWDIGSCASIDNVVGEVDTPDTVASQWHTSYKDGSTFTATTNSRGDDGGTSDPYQLFRVNGICEVGVFGYCGTSLVGAGAAISVGVTGLTGLFAGYQSAAAIDAADIVGKGALNAARAFVPTAQPMKIVANSSIWEWMAVADITIGNLDYVALWRPLTPGSFVKAV